MTTEKDTPSSEDNITQGSELFGETSLIDTPSEMLAEIDDIFSEEPENKDPLAETREKSRLARIEKQKEKALDLLFEASADGDEERVNEIFNNPSIVWEGIRDSVKSEFESHTSRRKENNIDVSSLVQSELKKVREQEKLEKIKEDFREILKELEPEDVETMRANLKEHKHLAKAMSHKDFIDFLKLKSGIGKKEPRKTTLLPPSKSPTGRLVYKTDDVARLPQAEYNRLRDLQDQGKIEII